MPGAKLRVALALLATAAGVARAGGASSSIGLDPPRQRAAARGVAALRPPLTGRVRFASGTFFMGSTVSEAFDALKLCRSPTLSPLVTRQAPLGMFCEEGGILGALKLEESDPDDSTSKETTHQVTLRSFDLDRTEVRVVDYTRCVVTGACAPPGFAPGDRRFDQPELPVTQVRWEDAAAYCAWAGGRLPTEAEWEYAARSASRRIFPWGDAYNPHLSNHGSFDEEGTDAGDGFTWVAPVGSFPDGATPQGVLDMAGNVAEWVSDFWGEPDEKGFGYSSLPATDPLGPMTGASHVLRGGSYSMAVIWLRTAARHRMALQRAADVGFRCAADAT